MVITDKESTINHIDVPPVDWLFIGQPWIPGESTTLVAKVDLSTSFDAGVALLWKANNNNADPISGHLANPTEVTLTYPGQNLFGTTEFTYGHDANGNGQLGSGEIAGIGHVYLTAVFFAERTQNAGYDPTVIPNAVLVPAEGNDRVNKTSRIVTGLGEHFEQLRLEPSSDIFSVEPENQGPVQNLTLRGSTAGNATLKAFVGKSDKPSATLDVLVRGRKNVDIKYIKTSIDPNTNPPLKPLTANSIKMFLNDITWGRQANIFSDVDAVNGSSAYDLDSDGKFFVPRTIPGTTIIDQTTAGEFDQLKADLYSNDHDITISHVRSFDDDSTDTVAFCVGTMIVTQDRANNENALSTIAHEVGHALGADHDGRSVHDLMYYSYVAGTSVRIRKLDWDQVHPAP